MCQSCPCTYYGIKNPPLLQKAAPIPLEAHPPTKNKSVKEENLPPPSPQEDNRNDPAPSSTPGWMDGWMDGK